MVVCWRGGFEEVQMNEEHVPRQEIDENAWGASAVFCKRDI